MKSNSTYKKLVIRITLVIALVIAMAVTTYAYVAATLTVANNTFTTGLIDIEIGYYNPDTDDYTGTTVFFGDNVEWMEPGATFTTTFQLKNNSTDLGGVYYKLYFDQVSGDLAPVIEAEIKYGDAVVLQGKVSDLSEANVEEGLLALGESRVYTVSFHYPELEGNEGMGKSLSFALTAKAVQTKNQDTNNVQFE